MNMKVRDIMLLVALMSFGIEGMGQVDSTIVSEKQLDEVVVKAMQRKNTFSKQTRVVSTITKAELKSAPIQSIADVLNYAAGVDIRTRGPVGVQSDISVRGGSFDQVLILLNGVNVTDPQTGHHNLNLPVDIASIERIEILQGPGARSFGPNAFSGAINFITTSPSNNSSRVSFSAGDFGYFSIGGETSAKRGDVGIFISASRQQSSGYIHNTDFELNNFYGNFTYSNKRVGSFELSTGVQDKGFGANSFYSPKYPNQYEATKAYINSARWSKDFGALNVTATGYWRRHFDRFDVYRYDAPTKDVTPNYHRTDVYGGNVKVTFFSILGKTLLGTEVRQESIVSTVLGNKLSKPQKITGSNCFYTYGLDRVNLSTFLEHSYNYKNLFLSAGVMFNHANDFGSSWYWGSDASYLLGETGVKFFIAANQSYRLPTFTDLFYKNKFHNGNPDLKPEKALTFELGAKYEKGNMNAQVDIYRRLADDVIDKGKSISEEKTTMRNLATLNTTGIEVRGGYKFNDLFIQNISVAYTYQKQNMDSIKGYVSMYILDYLRYKLTMSTSFAIIKGVSLSIRGSYQDRAGSYTDINNKEIEYKPFFTADARVMYGYKMFSVFAEASNLFDKSYFDIGNIAQPGRWFKAGVSITF